MKFETVLNPKRGCGHMKKGAFYLRGCEFSKDGVIPCFVEFEPYLPTLELQFRGYVFVNGLQFELSQFSKETFPFQYEEGLRENMLKAGYDGDMETELKRHLIRMQFPKLQNNSINFQAIDSCICFDILMWIGEKYYPTPHDFITEALRVGISKRIPLQHAPPKIWNNRTKIYFAHPKAIHDEKWKEWVPGIIGYAYLHDLIYTKRSIKDPQWIINLNKTGRINIVNLGEPTDKTNGKIEEFEDEEEK